MDHLEWGVGRFRLKRLATIMAIEAKHMTQEFSQNLISSLSATPARLFPQ